MHVGACLCLGSMCASARGCGAALRRLHVARGNREERGPICQILCHNLGRRRCKCDGLWDGGHCSLVRWQVQVLEGLQLEGWACSCSQHLSCHS